MPQNKVSVFNIVASCPRSCSSNTWVWALLVEIVLHGSFVRVLAAIWKQLPWFWWCRDELHVALWVVAVFFGQQWC